MTKDKWAAMTDEDRNQKIAELCGWYRLNGAWIHRDGYAAIPRFVTDLNAMHEVCREMPHDKLEEFAYALGRVLFGDHSNANDWIVYAMIHATSRQRAEAFVLTMEPE